MLQLLSKFAFAVSAVIMHVYLGRVLKVDDYGLVGIILNLMNINYLFLSNGIRQSVSMFVSRQLYSWGDLVRKSAMFQLGIGALLFTLNYYGSWIIAGLLGDHSMEKYIKQTAFIIPITAVHFLCIGVLNGEQRFGSESGMTILYSVLRLVCIPLLLLFPAADKLTLVINGLVFAVFSSSILGLVCLFTRHNRLEVKAHIGFDELARKSLALIFFYAGITLLMNVDTILLKRITSDDQVVGYYTAASSFSKIIYFISVALISVITPVISKKYHGGDKLAANALFLKGIDFFMLVLAPVFIILAASGRHLFALLYSKTYEAAGGAFAVLVPAIFLLSVVVYLNTVVHAVSTVKNAAISFALLGVNVVLNILLVPILGALGTGLSLLVPSMLGCMAMMGPVQRVMGIKVEVMRMYRHTCLISVVAVVATIVYQYINFTNIYWLFFSYVLLAGLSIIAMKLLGLIRKDMYDFLYIMRAN